MNTSNPYLNGLDKCQANYTPLTPVSFLQRVARTYPDHVAVIDAIPGAAGVRSNSAPADWLRP